MSDLVERLKQRVAIDDEMTLKTESLIGEAVDEIERLTNQLDKAREAIRVIVKENADFRQGMPDDWEGDPLQDAIDAANFNVLISLTDDQHEKSK